MPHLKNLHLLSVALMMLLLTSCSSLPTPLVTQTQLIDVPRVVYPRPAAVSELQVNVVVATPDRMSAWLSEIEAGDRQPEAFFGYTEPDYLTVAQWLQDVLHYVKAQNAVINAYELEAQQHNDRQDQIPPLINTSPK